MLDTSCTDLLGRAAIYWSYPLRVNDLFLQADGALVGSTGSGIGTIHHQIMGVISSGMWGEFDGAGAKQ